VICLLVCFALQNHGVFAAEPATPKHVRQLIQDARSPEYDRWMPASRELGPISNKHKELRATIWDSACVNTLGQRFVLIEPGSFSMGPDRHRSTELAIAHKVTLSKPFFMAATEVTNAEFAVFRENVPASPYSPDPDSPAVNVTWRDAVAFCEFLSEREGVRYRLPTEAEWEYACRAGSTYNWSHGRFRIGLGQYAWYKDAAGRASRVAQLKPNAWGLYDMQGNVMEWVSDWWSHSYYKECASSGIVTDPAGPAFGTSHVLRSGC
jgi:formylglycine-generating enzyme required for sulfatase activity